MELIPGLLTAGAVLTNVALAAPGLPNVSTLLTSPLMQSLTRL